MRRLVFIICLFAVIFNSAQTGNYFKAYNSSIGSSAISISTVSCKTFSFSKPVYRLAPDTLTGGMFITTRQKDASGKSYSNQGFHLFINKSDSACCVLEDSKLEIFILHDHLIFSGDRRSGLYNRVYGFEQFEYPGRLVFFTQDKKSGLIYNPALQKDGNRVLSCVNLKDAALRWNDTVPGKSNWSASAVLDDNTLLIASEGLHAVNIDSGLVWSHSFSTTQPVKPSYVYSPFKRETFDASFSSIYVPDNDEKLLPVCSNILVTDKLYFAGGNVITATRKDGTKAWETLLNNASGSMTFIKDAGNSLLLISLGVSLLNDNLVLTGSPYIKVFDKESGRVISENKIDIPSPLNDMAKYKKSVLLGGKNKVVEITADLKINCLSDLSPARFGNFLEFINGDEYYVEKEGFYVPLNFINDNVIYFKTDHGKVFGMNSNSVEYEYHFTELYRFNEKTGNKTLISKGNQSLLISENFELLQTFNVGDEALFHNNRIYFANGRLLHIIDMATLK